MADHKNYEISTAIDDLSSGSSSSDDSDFDDILSSSHSISQNSTPETAGKHQKSVQRMPTRRPDPNVSNRNALLARENRRKKKAYVETLEKELDGMKYTNKKLHKLLRKQMKTVEKLRNEKQYYKGLISNRSEIFNLVSALNTKVPLSSTFQPKASSCSPTDSNRSSSSLEPPNSMSYDYNDNDSSYEPYMEANWDQLLGMDDELLPDEGNCSYPTNSRCEVQNNIIGDHNYFYNDDDIKEAEGDSGLCLHITRGKISVEYCPSCHQNAKRSNILPEQLLVVD